MNHTGQPERSVIESLDAEQAILATAINYKDSIYQIMERLPSADVFHDSRNAIIYNTILAMVKDNQPIDLVTVSDRMNTKKNMAKIGGRAYLVNLTDHIASPVQADSYIDILLKKYTAREFLELNRQSMMKIQDGNNIEDIKNQQITDLINLGDFKDKNRVQSIGEILPGVLKEIEQNILSGNKISGLSTGFMDLDKFIGGLQGGDLIVVAGRPGMGKTVLGYNINENLAVNGIPSAIISAEMTKKQLSTRLLSSTTGIAVNKIIAGNLTEKEQIKIVNQVRKIKELPIYIDDTARPMITEVIAKAHKYHALYKIRALVIDYLQLLKFPYVQRYDIAVGEAASELKALAKQLNIPVILISQLNRDVEKRNPPVPCLADLRESGRIEQDADVVMFLYRPDYYNNTENYRKQPIPSSDWTDLIIAKQRNGPTGAVTLRFKAELTKFIDYIPF